MTNEKPHRASVRQIRRLLTNPARRAVMNRLSIGPASIADLAAEIDLPVEQIRYQLRRLKADGLVVVHGHRQRRGTMEQVFLADLRAIWAYETRLISEAPTALRDFQMGLLQALFGEILEAIRTGAFHDHPDHTVARVPLSLDAGGYREIELILGSALTRLCAIRDESLRRWGEVDEEGLPAVSALILLEQLG
jgi:DNA-binding transcriptional ArsR family regulator